MFVDASAFLAVLLAAPEIDQISDALEAAPRRYTSPLAISETVRR